MRYITVGRPSALSADFLSCYPSHKRPSFSDIQEPPLTMSAEPSSVGRAACLLNDEPIRIYVPLLMRPWIMQG